MNDTKRFTPLGKFVSFVLVLGLIGLGAWMVLRNGGGGSDPAETTEAESQAPGAPAADALGSVRSEAKARGPVPAPMPHESLGTGHGAREWSYARQVEFQRDSRHPTEVHAIRYDSQRNLIAMGVIPRPHRPRYAPDPFPIGFVPDPAPRWR